MNQFFSDKISAVNKNVQEKMNKNHEHGERVVCLHSDGEGDIQGESNARNQTIDEAASQYSGAISGL
jgi:hypothetical protein